MFTVSAIIFRDQWSIIILLYTNKPQQAIVLDLFTMRARSNSWMLVFNLNNLHKCKNTSDSQTINIVVLFGLEGK